MNTLVLKGQNSDFGKIMLTFGKKIHRIVIYPQKGQPAYKS